MLLLFCTEVNLVVSGTLPDIITKLKYPSLYCDNETLDYDKNKPVNDKPVNDI